MAKFRKKGKGRFQKHSLAIVYRNQWLNWLPSHHPDRPYCPNWSNQIGRFSYSRSYLKHCLTKSLFLQPKGFSLNNFLAIWGHF